MTLLATPSVPAPVAPYPAGNIKRYTKTEPCPVCGGHPDLPRGKGVRCFGFTDATGRWAHCVRPEYAHGIELNINSQTYPHRLDGPCKCGEAHSTGVLLDTSYPAEALTKSTQDDKPLPWRDTPDHVYDYVDEDGALRYQVVRYDATPERGKVFWQRRPDPDRPGTWLYRVTGLTPLPYNLPAVLTAPSDTPIIVVEGERCVESLREQGFVATTNSGGAGKWTDDLNCYFAGRHVVIIPDLGDKDLKGDRHALQVAGHLHGIAASVKILTLPALDKGDIVDWLAAGHTAADLKALIAAAPVWTPDALPSGVDTLPMPAHVGRRVVLSSFEDIDARPLEPMRYLVDTILPAGEATLLFGPAKSFKSFIALEMAVAVALGRPCLQGYTTERGTVVLLDLENDLNRLRERVRAILARDGHTPADLDGNLLIHERSKTVTPLHLDGDALAELGTVIEQTRPALLVVDNFRKALPPGIDENSNKDVNGILNALIPICERAGVALLLVHHTNKGREQFSGAGCFEGSMANTVKITREYDSNTATVRPAVTRNSDGFAPFGVIMGTDGALRRVDAPCNDADDGGAILKTLKAGGATIKELADATTVSQARVRAEIKRLARAGTVRKIGERTGGRGTPPPIYGLAAPDASD